jgi:hypothetical protein
VGADLKSADVDTVLNTYNVELYERFRAAGYDLTERHAMGSTLGHGTRNRPLLGFVKRHRTEDPKIQTELNIAIGYHVREGNERGVSLCLWAGADPHSPAPNVELSISENADPEDEEEGFIGWSAIEEAASHGHLSILTRLGPDPARDDFDSQRAAAVRLRLKGGQASATMAHNPAQYFRMMAVRNGLPPLSNRRTLLTCMRDRPEKAGSVRREMGGQRFLR